MGLSRVSNTNISCHWNVKNLMQKIQALLLGRIIFISNLSLLTCFLSNPLTFLAAPRLAEDPSSQTRSAVPERIYGRAGQLCLSVCLSVLHTHTLCERGLSCTRSSAPRTTGRICLVWVIWSSLFLWSRSGSCGQDGSRREQLRTGLMRGNQPP